MEDQELIDICNKIYNKHKKALDLIYEHRVDGHTQVSDAIKNALQTLCNEGQIIYENAWNYVFRTSSMDKALPLLTTPESAWASLNVYSYWLKVRDGRFCAVFELGGWNVPEDEMEIMLKIIDELKPGDKRRENFRYKRVFRTKWYDLNEVDDIEVEVEKVVRAAVSEIKSMEEKLLSKITNRS